MVASSTTSPSKPLPDVRARFPALAGEAAFLDGPGGSQVPQEVIDAMAAYMRDSNANLGGAFATSAGSDETMARGRAAAADFTGAEPEGIAFGANMTTLNFLLAHAVARTLRPGDEIVVTQLDHDANVSPWLLVAEDNDLVIKHAPIRRDDVTLDHDALEALVGERTKVIAFTLASNAVGSLTDPARVAAAAHRVGALAWADAVHYAPHRRLRAREWGIDVLLCSPYKFFGPHLGVAAIRPDLARSLPADRVRPAEEDPPGHRFETGTQSHEAVAGATAAIDYLRFARRRLAGPGLRADPGARGRAVAPLSRRPARRGRALRHPRHRWTHADVLLQRAGPLAARAGGALGRPGHLRLGRRLLRRGADPRTGSGRIRWSGARGLPALHDARRGRPAARRAGGL